jgi:hypothetical protein
MGVVHSTLGEYERYIQNFSLKTHITDPGVDKIIISKWTLKRYEDVDWIYLKMAIFWVVAP